jgi:hypothetical protein
VVVLGLSQVAAWRVLLAAVLAALVPVCTALQLGLTASLHHPMRACYRQYQEHRVALQRRDQAAQVQEQEQVSG